MNVAYRNPSVTKMPTVRIYGAPTAVCVNLDLLEMEKLQWYDDISVQ